MTKKYELTSESIVIDDGTVLYRIKALKDFSDVKEGSLGGYIESEKNLTQYGGSWVSDNAQVFGNALVFGNAVVSGKCCSLR